MNLNKLYIGVMSGTSMDGVDTALVEIEDNRVRLLAHDDYPMPAHIKQTLLSVCTGQDTNLKAIGELDHQLGHLFADAAVSCQTVFLAATFERATGRSASCISTQEKSA